MQYIHSIAYVYTTCTFLHIHLCRLFIDTLNICSTSIQSHNYVDTARTFLHIRCMGQVRSAGHRPHSQSHMLHGPQWGKLLWFARSRLVRPTVAAASFVLGSKGTLCSGAKKTSVGCGARLGVCDDCRAAVLSTRALCVCARSR